MKSTPYDLVGSPITNHDPINPSHYTSGKIETIDYIEDKLSTDSFEGYCAGNVLKYMSRYRNKNGLEDLKKAKWYLNRLIGFMEKQDG